MSAAASRMEGLRDDEDVLAYLPMAWIGQNIFSYSQWLVCGFTVNCPESADTVANDMREIGPTYYFAPPRVLEALLTQVTIRMEDAAAPKRALYRRAMKVAERVGGRLLDGDPGVPLVGPAALPPLRPADLRAAAQRARHEQDPRRVYRRRGDRSGPVRVLSLARHQHEAALRLDRDGGVRLHPAQWPGARRHRRSRGEGRRAADHRQRRGADPQPRPAARVLQESGGDPRSEGRRRLVPHRRRRLPGRAMATSRSSIAPRTSASSPTARCSHPSTSRTSSSSSPTSRKRSPTATAATR